MALTGKFDLRKILWGKVVLRAEEEAKPLWSKSEAVKRRWRDATPMDLAAPEMRHLIAMGHKPHLRSFSPLASRSTPAPQARDEARTEIATPAPLPSGEVSTVTPDQSPHVAADNRDAGDEA